MSPSFRVLNAVKQSLIYNLLMMSEPRDSRNRLVEI